MEIKNKEEGEEERDALESIYWREYAKEAKLIGIE